MAIRKKITKKISQDWERDALEKIALSALGEQIIARRWGIFFKALTFFYLFILLFLGFNAIHNKSSSGSHTALIEINGIIGEKDEVNAKDFFESIQRAYESSGTKGIILKINSPGGSPVQAGMINDEIKRQKQMHPHIPVYAVVEDICASGGYYIAVAADQIFVDKASIVGSIGVLMDGFGFTGTMKKLGLERRLMTAGSNKAMLDPFSPVNAKQQAFVQEMLNEVHQQFISVVKEGRGSRLKASPEMFSGLFWNGEAAVKLGLADGFGNYDFVAREIIKAEEVIDFTTYESFADRFARKFGASLGSSMNESLRGSILNQKINIK
ncbi:MAG: S49 family peptidase [Candidatus Methylopumilus sp.]|nr:S49 family peptidase [Candidatus Methylopumilus sp.]